MFGKILKELRRQYKVTQVQLAEILTLDKSSIAKYESANVTPSPEVLLKIADYFNVTTDYLLGRGEKTLDEQLDGVNFALFTESKELTEENKKDVLEFIRYKKSQQRSE